MQIDHLFVRVPRGGEEAAARLRAFGLIEGSGNIHPGQGTANRRFFFANAFVELLWIADAAEIANERTRPTMLRERLSGADGAASPFGICFRPAASFATWDYAPAYLPPGMRIGIAAGAPLSEPMWFYTSAGTPPEALDGDRRQPLDHPAGLRHITGLRCTLPSGAETSEAALASGVTLAQGDIHLLEITFDHAARGRSQDFRPALPVVFHY